MNDWTAKIDQLKKKLDLTSDAQAAKLLGISQQALSQIRRGETSMGPLTKLRLLDHLGFTSLRDALLQILPEEAAKKTRKKMNSTTQKGLTSKGKDL